MLKCLDNNKKNKTVVIVYLKNSDPGICSVIEESKLYPIQTNIDTTQRFTGIITFT